MSYRHGTQSCFVRFSYHLTGFETFPPTTFHFWVVIQASTSNKEKMLVMAQENLALKEDWQYLTGLPARSSAKISSECSYWTSGVHMSRVLKEEAKTGKDMAALRHHLRHLPDSRQTLPAS